MSYVDDSLKAKFGFKHINNPVQFLAGCFFITRVAVFPFFFFFKANPFLFLLQRTAEDF